MQSEDGDAVEREIACGGKLLLFMGVLSALDASCWRYGVRKRSDG